MWFIRLRKKLFELIKFTFSQKGKQKCLILGTPAHKNLGDHAIVYAQYKFLEDTIKDCAIMEMSRLEYETYRGIVKFLTPENTIIAVDGGGNLGTLWPVEDECIRDVIKRFNKNKVIVFPQTAYYEDSEDGRRLFEQTAKLIRESDKLLFTFRDKNSYELFVKEVGKERIVLCPDIVTYVDDAHQDGECKEQYVGICFRDDKEAVMDEKDREAIKSIIEKSGIKCKVLSTIYEKNVHAGDRNRVLKEKWAEFSSCKLIVTDRLHGMIFSAVTGTECIAFDNVSRKVYGGYSWLKGLDYVNYCDDVAKFEKLFKDGLAHSANVYDRKAVTEDFFEPLKKFLLKNDK